jgi:hypothetical protein
MSGRKKEKRIRRIEREMRKKEKRKAKKKKKRKAFISLFLCCEVDTKSRKAAIRILLSNKRLTFPFK